ncbi:MAG: ABC transporter substrate-binding protein, partial [Pseudomonadota bacterium]
MEQSEPRATTLRAAFNGSTDSVRPGFKQSRYASALVLATYDTLFEYRYLSRPLALVPSLAVAMPEVSEDGRTVTVRLRPDVRFPDDPAFPGGKGRTVSAADVAYSVLRHFDPKIKARRSDLWRDLVLGIKEWKGDYAELPAGIEVLDKLTIRFQLTARSPKFLHTLANPASAIIPREAEQAYGEELARRTVGTGPYQLDSLDETGAVLVRNPNFRERRFSLKEAGFDPNVHDPRIAELEGRLLPLVDRVEVSFVTDMTSRWLAFNNG